MSRDNICWLLSLLSRFGNWGDSDEFIFQENKEYHSFLFNPNIQKTFLVTRETLDNGYTKDLPSSIRGKPAEGRGGKERWAAITHEI